MSDNVKVKLVPMVEDDIKALRDARDVLHWLAALLDNEDYRRETRDSLYRIERRTQDHAESYIIPVPIDVRDRKTPLIPNPQEGGTQ